MVTIAQALDMAVKHHQAGHFQQAEQIYRRILQVDPHHVGALHRLGLIAHQVGKKDLASDYIRQALRLQPDYAEAHNNLGIVLREQGRLEEAVASYQQALRLKPNYAEASNNLANAFREQGRLEEAVASYQQALRLKPNYADAYRNLGLTLRDQGRLEEAVASYQQALRLKPDYAEAYSNLGGALKDQGRLEEAVASYQQALALKPDSAVTHKNLAITWLLMGDFERGWPEYEWRRKCEEFAAPAFHQPLWDGSDLQGKTILLYAEQGLGDTLQFIRYVPLVKQRGATVIVLCQKPLVRLLGTCAGIDHLVAFGAELPPFDVQAPLLSLPRILQTTLATVPADGPYLFAAAELLDHWRRELSRVGGVQIGIAWQGNPMYKGDRLRSIPLTHFASLARLEGVRLVSLQKGAGAEQLSTLADRHAILDLGSRLDEASGPFMDTAAVMRNLDLVITSDTAIPHLAGALGIPVWVALPFAPDWRWLLHREDSPWYPSMRLFRQQEIGNWTEVFARLGGEVKKVLASTPPTKPVGC